MRSKLTHAQSQSHPRVCPKHTHNHFCHLPTDNARHTLFSARHTILQPSVTHRTMRSHAHSQLLPWAPPVSTVALVVSIDPNPPGHPGSVGCKWTDTNYSKQQHVPVCVLMCACTHACIQADKLDKFNSRKREVPLTSAPSSNDGC